MNIQQNFELAAKACEVKDFKKAKALLKDIVEADGSVSEPYRLLGQIASEEGETDLAIDYLIEALKNDPQNMWALIMMGNVFAKQKGDIKTAKEYFDKVLSFYPDNSYALNNLAAVMMEVKDYEGAIPIFQKVKELDATYPNCYYGMALAYRELGKIRESFDIAVEGSRVSIDRTENRSVRTELLKVMLQDARDLVKATNYMNVVLGIKDVLQQDCPEPIKFIFDNTLKVFAKLEYAKYHGADEQIVRYNGDLDNFEHVMVHELGHLRMQLAASKAGTGKVLHKTVDNDNAFNRMFGNKIRKNLKGMDNNKLVELIQQVQEGICLQLMNCPLDLFVERYIYENYPVMRPIQLLVLFMQEQMNIKGAENGKSLSSFPTKIVQANRVMNICTALSFKEMYGIELTHMYKPTQVEYDQAKDLLDEFHAYWDDKNLKPGDEYELVEYFLSSFNMDDLITITDEKDFEAKTSYRPSETVSVDGGDYDIYTDEEKERQRKFEENSKKSDPARDMMMTMYILAALEEFAKMTRSQVRQIATEIAMLGMNGIDPGKKSGYRIPSIDRDFGGYLMLAYYYTSWKLTIPDMAEQLGLPYRDQYEAAQSLYEKKFGGRMTLRD